MDDVRIYESDCDAAIERLAQLDSTGCPGGRLLVAAVNGEPRAGLPLEGGRAIADPFHRTAELVSLLKLRLAQMQRSRRRRLGRLTDRVAAARRRSASHPRERIAPGRLEGLANPRA